ncbi:MAG: hypothetical protein KatS3mg035_0036 [Bacteroidia bacterium]|nr:MAG: hypothetical protein KatS3mg035_0036 [Bacteroidia bacterium]
MNLVRILKENLPDKKIFEIHSRNFIPPNYNDDLDQRCHEQVTALLESACDILVMPINVTPNFTEYSGLVLAHHIRLSSNTQLLNLPIIFWGFIDLITLLKLTPLARILLSDKVLYINLLNHYDIKEIVESLKKMEDTTLDIQRFLKTIELHPPDNYESHHSIDNEYALVRWSQYIGCYEQLPKAFKKEFDSRLYFKYLNIKKDLEEVNDKKQFCILLSTKTKILLIDDEEKKGWGEFYKAFFKNSPNITMQSSNISFDGIQDTTTLINQVKKKVIDFNPDIVLIDLRLIDNDFDENMPPESLTGIKAIELIKEMKQWIQVIVTTASNKVWNFNSAKQKGANDFIIKDGFTEPQHTINRLIKAIEICAKRADYLKKVDAKLQEILNNLEKNSLFNQLENIKNSIKNYSVVGFELLDSAVGIKGKENYIKFAFLQFFFIIEEFLKNKEYYEWKDQIVYVKSGNEKIIVAQKNSDDTWTSRIKFNEDKERSYFSKEEYTSDKTNPYSTDFKMSAVLIFTFGFETTKSHDWIKIRNKRNKESAHSAKNAKSTDSENSVTFLNDILMLLDFLVFITQESNIKS